MGGDVVTVFNTHLKSKLGEFVRPEAAEFAPEFDLANYDAVGRALGSARAALRRMAEAWCCAVRLLRSSKQVIPSSSWVILTIANTL